MNKYTWDFGGYQINASGTVPKNMSYLINWYLVVEDEKGSAAQASGIREVFPYKNGGTVVPFESITKEMLISWIEESFGDEEFAKIKSDLEILVFNESNPARTFNVPQWPPPTATPVLNSGSFVKTPVPTPFLPPS